MRNKIVGTLAAVNMLVVLAAQGCDDQSSPQTISDGVRKINKNMRGYWNAPGGTNCRWWIVSADGKRISNNGNTTGPLNKRVQKPGKQADFSQSVILGTGNIGESLRSDKCGGWTKKS